MSDLLLRMAKAFVDNKIEPSSFVEDYIIQWKRERDCGEGLLDSPQMSEVLSSIFCIADMFNPNEDKEDYEFDADQLRHEIGRVIGGMTP
ncbi:colicin immunity domain-containing protein [Roseateles sp. SL47]|uniref:colicin immunity domain-containing protein n=1 Tax=Roseateles sp. SL47 TaxID=2995138 RepID=UPI002270AFEF|nr:colicin immunity domain-containing protein [Roseateles sp. SL47]WAC71210.1 colicin immunity domain-containing protein [Roseateles sp. SL47]